MPGAAGAGGRHGDPRPMPGLLEDEASVVERPRGAAVGDEPRHERLEDSSVREPIKQAVVARGRRDCQWLSHTLVEKHADQERQRIVGEQGVGGGVSGDVKGHGSIVPRATLGHQL